MSSHLWVYVLANQPSQCDLIQYDSSSLCCRANISVYHQLGALSSTDNKDSRSDEEQHDSRNDFTVVITP